MSTVWEQLRWGKSEWGSVLLRFPHCTPHPRELVSQQALRPSPWTAQLSETSVDRRAAAAQPMADGFWAGDSKLPYSCRINVVSLALGNAHVG